MNPLPDQELTLLAQRYASLVHELELGTGEPLLVLPDGDFFPDRFEGDQASVEVLVARLSGYAGLEDVEISAELEGATAEGCGTENCGTGACGPKPSTTGQATRIQVIEGGYRLHVAAAELSDPIVMTSRLATALAAVYLVERHPRGAELCTRAFDVELTAVALGFGVLLLEASYLYKKSCGGPSVGKATALDAATLSGALGLFLAREKLSPKAAKKELGATQRELLDSAWIAIEASPALVEGLQSQVARIADGRFKLRDGGSFFKRWFGKKSAKDRETLAFEALERGASVDEIQRLLETEAPRR